MGLKIAVTGEIRSGKDTVCDYIEHQIVRSGEYVGTLYFAEGIEEIIKTYFPEAFEGNKKPRKHYQDVGQYMRQINPDVWVNYTENQMKRLEELGFTNFLVTDLRQENEYKWVKENDFTVIKVETEPEIRIERMKMAGDKFELQDLLHDTERQIKYLNYDYLVENNTTIEDLYEQLDYIMADLQGGCLGGFSRI